MLAPLGDALGANPVFGTLVASAALCVRTAVRSRDQKIASAGT
jgi:hypothetical protein